MLPESPPTTPQQIESATSLPPLLPISPSAEPTIPVSNPFTAEEFRLNWSKRDIEQRLGFRGGRFTSVNKRLTLLMGLLVTVIFFSGLIFGAQRWPE
ncbi:MAG: hypothetical protein WCK17_18595, partial [Verrucomicrobiota bacterium]